MLVAYFVLSQSHEFLKVTPKERKERVSEEDVKSSLLAEVEGTLGTGSATNRLRLLEASLKPMFDALPKNTHGNLGHSTVRYALHRLFISRHGWSIKGLGRHVEAESNITSLAGVLKDQVPAYIQNLFESRLGDQGLGLHEVAVMASTLEHLIHKEAVAKLGHVYKIFKKLPSQEVSSAMADEFLDTYMMALVLGEDMANMTSYDARVITYEMPELYLGWKDTQQFVRRIRANVTQTDAPGPMSFASLAKVVEVVGEEFGNFQDIECKQLKQTLGAMEFAAGRVKVSDFYKPAVGGGWQFQESVPYLRQLGALDESDPNAQSVIIPNYLHSQTNCISSSGYYSVCCKDECEALFGQLEEKIVGPEAKPATIVAIVERMASSTVVGPRKLAANLLDRLNDVAEIHEGMIPLHGRLFAQWMHYAYPRECPYPHVSGTTRQQTPDEWLLETGTDAVATLEQMTEFTNQTSVAEESNAEFMLWSSEEELLVVRQERQTTHAGSPFASLRPVVLLVLAGALAFGLVQSARTTSKAGCDTGNEKFLV
jgi:hypothetical protein